MRIISKQRDYYDPVQAYGQDQNLVFVRNAKELDKDGARIIMERPKMVNGRTVPFRNAALEALGLSENPNERRPWRGWRWGRVSGHIHYVMIGVCGEFYPCVRFQEDGYWRSTGGSFHLYSQDADDLGRIRKYYHDEEDYEVECQKIRKFLGLKPPASDDMFHKAGAPILVFNLASELRHNEWAMQVNGVLADYAFYRVEDAFSMFQRIEQYISGVLGLNERETLTISDRDMRDAKGFNDWSFKKRPSK